MRLGAYIMRPYRNAEEYVALLRQRGYRAAYCPEYLRGPEQAEEIADLKRRLRESDILLAEVGTWVNPLSPRREEREAARAYLIDRLRLADALEARCCVNVLGSLSGEYWYAPCAGNFREEFFEAAAEVYREIIDAADPRHTKMTFELMPYSLLDGVPGYLRFLRELDRPEQTAVHLDPINMIHDPRGYYGHRAIFADAVEALGPWIASVHVKDLRLSATSMNVHLDEVPPGQGEMDLGWLLECLSALPGDIPLMLEHLPDDGAYGAAAEHVRKLAGARGIAL